LHIPVRTHLDQRNGEASGLTLPCGQIIGHTYFSMPAAVSTLPTFRLSAKLHAILGIHVQKPPDQQQKLSAALQSRSLLTKKLPGSSHHDPN
jgi:hypothetical protein